MWGMITALVSGALMSIQGVFNSAVMKQTCMWVSAGWVQISAFVVCLLMWLFTGRGAVSGLWQIEPRYMLTGGVIGAFITYTVIKSFDALGPAKSALLIVVAQILVAYLIEVFGWSVWRKRDLSGARRSVRRLRLRGLLFSDGE